MVVMLALLGLRTYSMYLGLHVLLLWSPFLLHLFSFPQATDGGGNKVTAPITITVADINDNKPVFQGPFDRTINESFALVETVGLCCGRL